MNVHIQQVVRMMALVDANVQKLVKKNKNCKVEIQHLGKEQEVQEVQSSHLEERLKVIEDLMEDQVMKIIGLEGEVVVLRLRKACTCGERTMTMSGSGSQEDPVTLEYAEDEGSSSGLSYHLPIVAQEEPLLIFGSPVPQLSPEVPEVSCACPVPAIIRIKDDMEMTTAPSENEEAIPVPPRYSVGIQHTSQGCPMAHHHPSTCCTNCHAKQLGYCPYSSLPHFMDQDLQFPCTREFHAHILTSGGRADPLEVTSFY